MSAIKMTCWRCDGTYIAGMVGSMPWPAHVCADGVNPGEVVCETCGHRQGLHNLIFGGDRRCIAQVDKRHVTAGGGLSPCDCDGFKAGLLHA